MDKFFFIIGVSLICWAGASAQQNSENIVYLTNGSVFKGKILIQNADGFKIEICCGNILSINPKEISHISSSIIKSGNDKLSKPIEIKQKGFCIRPSFGFLVGQSDVMGSAGFSFRTEFAYQFSNLLSTGVGLGIESYLSEIIPLYLSIKSEFFKMQNTPVAIISIGYGFPLDKSTKKDYYEYAYQGGFNAGFEFGILSHRSGNMAFMLTAGYQYQRIIEEYTSFDWYGNSIHTNTYDFNKIALKIGFLF